MPKGWLQKMTSKEQEDLLKKYNGFVHFMAKKYHGSLKIHEFDDLLQEFRMCLIEAKEKHDETQGKFTTFAGLTMKHRFLRILRDENAEKRPNYLLSLDEEVSDEFNKNSSFLDFAEPMWDNEKTPHEIYVEEKFSKDILRALNGFHRGFITKQLLYEEKSVKEVSELNNMSEDLVRLTHKLNVLRLKTIFKDEVILSEGDDKFDLDDFNNFYERGFFDGK